MLPFPPVDMGLKDSLENICKYLENISARMYPELNELLEKGVLTKDDVDIAIKGIEFIKNKLSEIIARTVGEATAIKVLPDLGYAIVKYSIDPTTFDKDSLERLIPIRDFIKRNREFVMFVYRILGRFYYAILYPRVFLEVYKGNKKYSCELEVADNSLKRNYERILEIILEEIKRETDIGVENINTFLGEYT